jgi:hypothetical protein
MKLERDEKVWRDRYVEVAKIVKSIIGKLYLT